MSIEVTITTVANTAGLDRLIARFAGIEALVAEFAQRIHDLADPNIPRKSGADAATLSVQLEGMAAIISLGGGLEPPYGVYQERGFHHWKSGQFIQNAALVPAFEQIAPEFVAAVRALIAGG